MSFLEEKVELLIRELHWKDFEVLVDLIFRQVGWQRNSELGKTQKTLDLDLLSPINSERYGIQIKSTSNLSEFRDYQDQFRDMKGFRRFYFIVHSPTPDLMNAEQGDDFVLMLPPEIARWVVKYGLTDWIIDKAG